MAFDIGYAATDRPANYASGNTVINKGNPASANGTITQIEIYLADDSSASAKVGIFYVVSGNTLKCRDSAVVGVLAKDGKRTVGGLSLSVLAGDYIGFWDITGVDGGNIDRHLTGQPGCWRAAAEVIDPGDQAVFTFDEGDCISLYGTGDPILEVPTVTTQAASDIHGTTAVGNGTIVSTGGEDCDKRGIVYSTSSHGDPGDTAPADSDYESYEEEEGTFDTGAFTRDLTSLPPGVTHYARAYAHNSEGYGYGDEVNFTTLSTPIVTTQRVIEIFHHRATGNGNITDIGGETPTKRGACWNTTGTPTVADNKAEEDGSFGTGAFTVTMTGLAIGQKYYVRAYAYNSYGYGYGSDVEMFGGWIPSETGDGSCYNTWGDWDVCRAGNLPQIRDAGLPIVANAYQSASFWITRGFLYFDLSHVPASLQVTRAVLSICGQTKGSTPTIVVVVEGNQSDTLVATDYQLNKTTETVLGTIASADLTLEAYNNITLNQDGVDLVKGKIGDTLKLCLKNEDDNNDDPMAYDINRSFAFYPGEEEGKEPVLLLYAQGGEKSSYTDMLTSGVI